MASPLGGLFPLSVNHFVDSDPAADATWNFWRAFAACQVDGVYAVNDAAIATSTNTLAVTIGKRAGGTGTFTTIANFVATATWAADTPRTGTLTAANTKLAAGDWLAFKWDETGTGLATRMAVHVDLLIGYET